MGGTEPNNKIVSRAAVICAVIATLLLFLGLRILFIQIFDFKRYEQQVLDQITRDIPVSAERGEIYDTNGVVLATNVTTYTVFVDPAAIVRQSVHYDKDFTEMISVGLSSMQELEVTYEYVKSQIDNYTNKNYRSIQKHISEETADKIRQFLKDNEIDDLGLVHLETTSKRYYPYGELGAHVLGFTSADGEGLYGIESQYDEELSGTDGRYITAKDSAGNKMPYDFESYIPAVDGYSIVTTIDVYIQAELEEQVKQAYIDSEGQNRACGVVMDVNTGAILAMATYPTFDLNEPWTLNDYAMIKLVESGLNGESEDEEERKEYENKKLELLLETWNNKVTSEIYMPGSTFKVITAAIAYEEDLVNEEETFSCPGYHYVLGQKIRCHKLTGHGTLNFARGIQQSCNPVLMMMGARIGQSKFYDYFNAFGYKDKTGIDLPGEGVSIFFKKENFTELDLAVTSFGQNFKISVLQHICAISSVANGGDLMTPYLVKEIRDNDGNTIYKHESEVKRQVVSEETCNRVSEILMEGVATDGGAKNAYVAGYRVAAKTGTSEKKDTHVEGYTPYVCSTVAYAPADDPEIAVLIIVDEPTTSTNGMLYGSVIAAPYVGKVLEEVLPYYGVEAVYTDKELEKQAIVTPWLIKLSVERAQSIAENRGIKIEIVGDGDTVLAQSPSPEVLMEKTSAKVIIYTTEEAKNNREKVKVPDLMGSTALAANGTLQNYGLNIKISGTNNYMSGSGAVVYEQSHAPGTEVYKGTVIELRFMDPNVTDDDPETSTKPEEE